jgi:hypothetical protein
LPSFLLRSLIALRTGSPGDDGRMPYLSGSFFMPFRT